MYLNTKYYPELVTFPESPSKDIALRQAAKKLGKKIDEISEYTLHSFIIRNWLKTATVAKRLGIGPDVVIYHARRGRMHFVKIPWRMYFSRRLYFEPKSVDAFAKIPRSPGRKVKAF